MIQTLYCMKDDFIGYMLPSPVANDQAAIRAFKDAVDGGKVPHPEHMSLWCIGSFDDQTGELASSIKCLCKASDLIAPVSANSGDFIESGEADNEVL